CARSPIPTARARERRSSWPARPASCTRSRRAPGWRGRGTIPWTSRATSVAPSAWRSWRGGSTCSLPSPPRKGLKHLALLLAGPLLALLLGEWLARVVLRRALPGGGTVASMQDAVLASDVVVNVTDDLSY